MLLSLHHIAGLCAITLSLQFVTGLRVKFKSLSALPPITKTDTIVWNIQNTINWINKNTGNLTQAVAKWPHYNHNSTFLDPLQAYILDFIGITKLLL